MQQTLCELGRGADDSLVSGDLRKFYEMVARRAGYAIRRQAFSVSARVPQNGSMSMPLG
jgi:hypothetical protein